MRPTYSGCVGLVGPVWACEVEAGEVGVTEVVFVVVGGAEEEDVFAAEVFV